MKRKGISPVIATVIIVAVAIAIAIAVAFWMTGIVGLFTGFEQVKVVNAYAEWDNQNQQWSVVVTLKNTGTSDATIDDIFINGKPLSAWTGITATIDADNDGNAEDTWQAGNTYNPVPFPAGNTGTITLTIQTASGLQHGQSVEVKVHTASGQEYPKLVVLP